MSEHDDGGGTAREPFSGQPLPLNSRRLTRALLEQLAKGLGVPAASSPDETRQLIEENEGKLTEMEREPTNVQVLLQEVTQGTRIGLQDSEGVP